MFGPSTLKSIEASIVVALVFVNAMFGAGCALSPAGQADLGRKEARKVEQTMGIVESTELANYVQSIADRLSRHADTETTRFQVEVVDTAEPNAFALPGGYLFVSRGLLTLINSEAELAGVIGHEMGHVIADHAIKRIGVTAPFAITTGLAGFATGLISPKLGRAVKGTGNALAGGLVIAPFSRDQERDADRIGVTLSGKAGWDPAGLSRFLDTLMRDDALEPERESADGFLATHPTTPERVRNTTTQAAGVQAAPTAPIADRDTLLSILDGLLLGEDPAQGLFIGQTFMQPDMNFALQFPKGWETRNLPSAVVGAHPSIPVQFGLQLAGRGDDPWAPYSAATEELNRSLPAKEFQVAGLPGVRTELEIRTGDGPRTLQVAWIAHENLVYEILSIGPPDFVDQYASAFDAFVESFHPLGEAEREEIVESRLRIEFANAGESLGQLLERTGSNWTLPKTAVVNRLPQSGALEGETPVKVSVEQRYRKN